MPIWLTFVPSKASVELEGRRSVTLRRVDSHAHAHEEPSEMNERQIVLRKFLVPCHDTAVVLDPVHEPLYKVAALVSTLAELAPLLAAAARGGITASPPRWQILCSNSSAS